MALVAVDLRVKSLADRSKGMLAMGAALGISSGVLSLDGKSALAIVRIIVDFNLAR